jgi:hypothetical protein
VTEPTTQLLRAPDVLERSGATYRQVDYWARAGYVSPVGRRAPSTTPRAVADRARRRRTGSGYDRFWHPDEVEVIRRMVTLVRAGLSVEVAATAARVPGPVDLGHGITLTAPWTTP